MSVIRAQSKFKPKELQLDMVKYVFSPYQERDFIRIVNKKLSYVKEVHEECDTFLDTFLNENIIRYTAKRVSKLTGDIRVVLDLFKSAIESIMRRFDKQASKAMFKQANTEEETKSISTQQEDTKDAFHVDIDNPKITLSMISSLSKTKFG